MKLYMVRHGEPSYTPCTQRELKGQGRDLAALNDDGIAQMEWSARTFFINTDAQVILSSPYTRALQSAAILAKKIGLTTKVEHDLHEWIPDLTFSYSTYKELKKLYEDFYKHRGARPTKEEEILEYTRWEPLEEFRDRVRASLISYYGVYDTVIIVTHGMVIQALTGKILKYGEMIEVEYEPEMPFPEWKFTEPT